MKVKLSNILENTFALDKGIICLNTASSGNTDYQMKQRIKHTWLNLEYSGYVYTTLFGKLYVNDKVVNESATAFLVMDNKNDQMLREKLLELALYYQLSSICWISADDGNYQTISLDDLVGVVPEQLNTSFVNSNVLSININGMRLEVPLEGEFDNPYNYFKVANVMGKWGIASGAKKHWKHLEV